MAEDETTISIEPPRLEALCEALRKGCTRRQAIAAASLSKTTFYRRLKGDRELRKLVEFAESASISTVENALWKSATGGNVTAQIFYLINRAPEAWKDRQALAVAAANIPVATTDPAAIRLAFNQLNNEATILLQEQESRRLAEAYPAMLAKQRAKGTMPNVEPASPTNRSDRTLRV